MRVNDKQGVITHGTVMMLGQVTTKQTPKWFVESTQARGKLQGGLKGLVNTQESTKCIRYLRDVCEVARQGHDNDSITPTEASQTFEMPTKI